MHQSSIELLIRVIEQWHEAHTSFRFEEHVRLWISARRRAYTIEYSRGSRDARDLLVLVADF